MSSSKYLPPLVCGFAAAVLLIVPGIKNIGFCLVVPAASVVCLFLNKKINKQNSEILTRDAFFFGIFTGVFSALFLTGFDIMLTSISKTNDLVETLPFTRSMLNDMNLGPIMNNAIVMMEQMVNDIQTKGFSLLYSFMMLISNLIINTIFGMIGGLAGMSYLNKKLNQ